MSAVTSKLRDDGILVVTMAQPPVNALSVQGWFDVAEALNAVAANPAVKVVILRAEGKGFNAGVDIKEMQNTIGFDALIGANKGCFAAFKAVYECAVPVIAAVNGFCVGGGVGLVGNADIVVASDDAYFGVPEVNQGALGAATHMARLVPQQMMRALYFTAATIPASELHRFGSIYRLVPRAELDAAALAVAAEIAAKDGRVIRAAKEALNGIEPVDVNHSYRFEQGFTFELNLMRLPAVWRTTSWPYLRNSTPCRAMSGYAAATPTMLRRATSEPKPNSRSGDDRWKKCSACDCRICP